MYSDSSIFATWTNFGFGNFNCNGGGFLKYDSDSKWPSSQLGQKIMLYRQHVTVLVGIQRNFMQIDL